MKGDSPLTLRKAGTGKCRKPDAGKLYRKVGATKLSLDTLSLFAKNLLKVGFSLMGFVGLTYTLTGSL